MLLAQGQIGGKNMAFYVSIGCVRFARYCGKMYSRHLFPYGGLLTEVEYLPLFTDTNVNTFVLEKTVDSQHHIFRTMRKTSREKSINSAARCIANTIPRFH